MCDIWVAMSDATCVGNVMMGKNSDRPIFDCQPLVFYLRGKCPTGNKVVPPPKTEEDEFSPDSYWWLSRRLMDKKNCVSKVVIMLRELLREFA